MKTAIMPGKGRRLDPKAVIGKVFGQWKIVSLGEPDHYGNRVCEARCSCGTKQSVAWHNIVRGMSTKCRECAFDSMRTYVPNRCADCGIDIDRRAVRCMVCHSETVVGKSRKFRVALTTIARLRGCTKQNVSLLVKKYGYKRVLAETRSTT